MDEVIYRQIWLLSRHVVVPIEIVSGSQIPIRLEIMDYTIPAGAIAKVYSTAQNGGPVYIAPGTVHENTVAFTPPDGFFTPGRNRMQLELNDKIIPLSLEVICQSRVSLTGDPATPEAVTPLTIRAEAAASNAEASATAAENAKTAAQNAKTAAENAKTAAQNAKTAAENAKTAAQSAATAILKLQVELPLWQLVGYSGDEQLILLETGVPQFRQDIANSFGQDGPEDSTESFSLTLEGQTYAFRRRGKLHDSLLFRDGAWQLCRRFDANGDRLGAYVYESISLEDPAQLLISLTLPASPRAILDGQIDRVTYSSCGAFLDGVHDDFESMYRAHILGNRTGCRVEQHSGTIYKALGEWLVIRDHDVDLSGCTLLIDNYNRTSYYWIATTNIWEDSSSLNRSEMIAGALEYPSAAVGFPTGCLFKIRRENAVTRYDSGSVTQEDRSELVRHALYGRIYQPLLENAGTDADVTTLIYPERQLSFRGCRVHINVTWAGSPLYFLRCQRSNTRIWDLFIEPTRSTVRNTAYRGTVLDLRDCADMILERILGVNIAGYPTEAYPHGTSGYLLRANCVNSLTVRDSVLMGFWGAVGLNGVKDVIFRDCLANRVDVHDYFDGLTISGCTIYGQAVQLGWGKGQTVISDCRFLLHDTARCVSLRCDYGGFFGGQIQLSNINVVYTGPGSFDLVTGTPMYTTALDEATGLTLERYPRVTASNVQVQAVQAGVVLRMPQELTPQTPGLAIDAWSVYCGSATLALTNVTAIVSSDTARLRALIEPHTLKITAHPVDVSAETGASVSFTVTAQGSNLSYQWQTLLVGSTNWINTGVSGNKTATITLTPNAALNGRKYRCAVSDGSETVYSNPATLTLTDVAS